jgi:hypothetical protein
MKNSLPPIYSGGFKLLTQKDLETLGIKAQFDKQASDSYNRYRDFVRTYYPHNAALAEVMVDSEYNDNTYDNQIQMLVVYDENGDELVPNKDTARKCREEMRMLGMPGGRYDSSEPEESFFVQMDPKFPDLYVKV